MLKLSGVYHRVHLFDIILTVKNYQNLPSSKRFNTISYLEVKQSRYRPGRPEGSRKLRFPDFVTTAQDGGKVVSLTHPPPLPPGDIPATLFC